jgi:hypothetical protein
MRERAHGRTGLRLLPAFIFSHPSFSLLKPFVAIRPANAAAATITIGGRSPATQCIGRGVWRAHSNGARSIRAMETIARVQSCTGGTQPAAPTAKRRRTATPAAPTNLSSFPVVLTVSCLADAASGKKWQKMAGF